MDRPFPRIALPFRSVLLLFLAIDICFILIHGVGWATFRLGWTPEITHAFRISDDRSIPESFNYVKWTILVLALGWISLRDRWLTAFLWSVVFLLILLDDSLKIHETFGAMIAGQLGLEDGKTALDPADVGELIYAAIVGSLVATLAAISFFRADAVSRHLSLVMTLVLGAFAFFSVVMDAVQRIAINAYPQIGFLQDFFALVEESGEMFVASTAAALLLAPPLWLVLSRPTGNVVMELPPGPADNSSF